MSSATLAPLFRAYADLWQCLSASCASEYGESVAARRSGDPERKDAARLESRRCISGHCRAALRGTLLALLAHVEAELAEHKRRGGEPLKGLESNAADLRKLVAAGRDGSWSSPVAAELVASMYAHLTLGTSVLLGGFAPWNPLSGRPQSDGRRQQGNAEGAHGNAE